MNETPVRHILHIDMDAFFASIEQRDHPELRGKPVLVGGSATERGVVSTASYEARKYGCHSAMPMSTAIRLCPHAVVLPGSMRRYSQVSHQIFEIMESFTPMVEPVSVDEAFLDITGCEKLFGTPVQIAEKIKKTIHEKTQLTASAGLATNKFLAKLASDLNKPDGLVVVPEDAIEIEKFLDPLPVSRLWGVGKATMPKFEKLHLRTFADVRKLPLAEMERHFGSAGEMFYQFVRGIDDRSVTPESETKSISSETTFPVDVSDLNHLRTVLLEQIDLIAGRLRRHQLLARTVTLKLRRPDFGTITRSLTLEAPTTQTDVLWNAISSLFEKWASNQPFPVRLIGAGLSSLAPHEGRQLMLFDREENERKEQLDQTVDQIRTKFGFDAIKRGLATPKKESKKKPNR
jgi:DNA polymerase-4